MYILKNGLRAPWLGSALRPPHRPRRLRHRQHGPGEQRRRVGEGELRRRPAPVSGVVIVVLTGVVILGGITRIADVTQFLVPFMCLSYLLGAGGHPGHPRRPAPGGRRDGAGLGLHRPRRGRRLRGGGGDAGPALRRRPRALQQRGRPRLRADGPRHRAHRPPGAAGALRHLRGVRGHDPRLRRRPGSWSWSPASGRTASPAPRSPRRRSRPGCPGCGATSWSRRGSSPSPSRRSSAGRSTARRRSRTCWGRGRSCPTALLWLVAAYVGATGLAAPRVGRGRHAQRPHGPAEPRGPAAAEPGGRPLAAGLRGEGGRPALRPVSCP